MIYYNKLYYNCNYMTITIQYDVIYTWFPLEDSRLFGPSPWKILAATNGKDISEQPSPWRKFSKRESCYGDRVYSAGLPFAFSGNAP